MNDLCFEDSKHPKASTGKDGNVVFDTTKVIVTSQMLCSCYENENTIIFSNSNKNVLKYVLNLKADESIHVVYIDVVADNIKTILVYEQLLKIAIECKLNNVYIIPIPCIEFYVIQCFGRKCNDWNIIEQRGEYQNTDTYKYNMKNSNASFEKYCKAVASKIVPQKYRGSVNVQDFNIPQKDCIELLQSLPVYIRTKSVEYDSGVNIIDCITSQFKLLYKQYENYCKRQNFVKYNLLELQDRFNEYIKFIEENNSI